ncbi:hypothetical protein ACRAWD_31995 [Caulobacter segnis]
MVSLSRFLAIEAVVSAVINGLLSAAFVMLFFSGRGTISAYGAGGFAPDFPIQSFMVALMSVTVPSLIAKKRLAAGALAPLSAASAGPLWRRAVFAALGAAVALGGAAMVASVPVPSLGFAALLTVKVVYGALLGASLTVWALKRIVIAA